MATKETITIKLPKDKTGNADPRGVFVAVNGKGMFVPRGKEVEIPIEYWEVIKNSMNAEDEADDYITAVKKRTNKQN